MHIPLREGKVCLCESFLHRAFAKIKMPQKVFTFGKTMMRGGGTEIIMTSGFIELIEGYIRSELIILIFVLYFIMKILEDINLDRKPVYITVCAVSVAMCAMYIFATACKYTVCSVLLSIFSSVTQGIVIAGCAIYGTKYIKARKNTSSPSDTLKNVQSQSSAQSKNKNAHTENTSFVNTKPENPESRD